MSDLLQSQIQESCRLALPEGLKDLMSDISREVLRAQPLDLMNFIADYLSALLVTRENLSIASRVCTDICNCGCQPELEGELRNIGLYDEHAAVATEIITEHFFNGEVHEANILMKILKRIDIDEDQLVDVQNAIRNAFIRHQANHTIIYESLSESDKDEIDGAVRHTLKVYKKTKPSQAEYEAMALKIQASYRAYGVKKYCQLKHHQVQEHRRANEKNVKLMLPKVDSSMTNVYEEEDTHKSSSSLPKPKLFTVSSSSLAGSHMFLPKYKPYSVHDSEPLSDLEESPERENAHIDYTAENPHVSIFTDKPLFRYRKISFDDEDDESVPEVIDYAIETHDFDARDMEHVDEEIVGIDREIEDSDINDENVIALDADVENNVSESLAGTDKSVKSGSYGSSTKDDDIKYDEENKLGSGHQIIDDMTGYGIHEDHSRECIDEYGSGNEF